MQANPVGNGNGGNGGGKTKVLKNDGKIGSKLSEFVQSNPSAGSNRIRLEQTHVDGVTSPSDSNRSDLNP